MIKDLKVTDDGAEGQIDVPMFGKTVELLVEGDVECDYLDRCAELIDSQGEALTASLRSALEEMPGAQPRRRLFAKRQPATDPVAAVKPSSVSIWVPRNPEVPGFTMELEWDSDREHGLQWCVLGLRTVHLGPFEGSSPWDFAE
jgi:hypothetical protein